MVPNALSGNIVADNGVQIPTLGFITWWNVREVEVNRDWFKQALDGVGLDGEKYAREHNYRATFIRCLRSLEEQRIIRKVREDGTVLTYQFTAEALIDDPENPRLEYTPETIVEIDKEAYWTEGDFNSALTKCDEKLRPILIGLFEKEKTTYRSSDLTRYIQRILSDEADIVSLRPQGSVYFVPAAYETLVNNIATVLNSVPKGEARLEFFPVPDVKTAREMVGNGVAAEVGELFAKMEAEIQKMQQGDAEITEKWVEYRQDKIKEIKKRLDSYAQVLGDTGQKLTGKFDQLATLLKPRVLEV